MHRRQVLKLGGIALANACFPMPDAKAKENHAWSKIEDAIKKQSRFQSSLTLLYPKGSYDNVKVVMTAFEQEYGIKIKPVEASTSDIASEMILQQSVHQNYFDIALPPTFSVPNLAHDQIIKDLTQLAAQYEPVGYFDSSLYQIGDRFLGRLYGYQADGDAYLLFYNKKFINNVNFQKRYEDQYQTSLKLPKTWRELDQQIQFFHQPEKGIYGGSLFRIKNLMVGEFWIRLHARGLYPVSLDMTPQINRDEAVDELEKMIRLNAFLEPNVDKHDLFDNFSSFAKGDKFCNLGWGGTQKYLVRNQAPIKDQLAWSPALSYEENSTFPYTPVFNWGWNYVVSSKSKHAELAYLFCLFASSVRHSTSSIQQAGGYFDPHREEHYHDPAIETIYGKDFLIAHAVSLHHSIPDFYIQGQSQYMAVLSQGIFNASQGRLTAKRALDLVANRWEKITDKLGRANQITQWHSLRNAYPPFFKRRSKNPT